MELLTDINKAVYQRGWDKVFAKYQGTVFLVPTEASSVIFQYKPNLTISCTLPSKERELLVEWPKDDRLNAVRAQIKFPDLVFSHTLFRAYDRCYKNSGHNGCHCDDCYKVAGKHPFACFCPQCKDFAFHRLKNIFKVYSLNSEGLHNWAFANVGSGDICFGNQRPARNLRQANSNFWGSAFNNSNNVATFHPISTCPNILHRYPASQHHEFLTHSTKVCKRKVIHTCHCSCIDKQRHHHFSCSGCRCACQCECCQKRCKCICSCSCCRSACACSCKCDLRLSFVEFLKKIALENQGPVHDYGKYLVFGNSYLKAPSYCDGIFISYLKNVIDKIDAEPLTDARGQCFIAGFARQIPDNEWEVRFGDKIYLFTDKEIVIG